MLTEDRRPATTASPRMRPGWLALLWLASVPALAVDWSGVKEREVLLFYPGQGSWEWVMTEKDHSGAPKFREGKNCAGCHDGEQKDIGERIVKGEKLEPAPIAGKPGSIALKVATAHDAERLYFRLSWTGGPAGANRMDPDEQSHITVMIDNGQVKEAARAGCWGSCHDDAIGMASAPAGKEITKYLGASRVKLTRQGGGENFKSQADLDALLAQGTFLEYWQARLNPGKPADAAGGWILDRRHEHDPVVVAAEAEHTAGAWTVTLSRPLKAAGKGQKDIVPGTTYHLGFALHDDYADHRYHFVSLEQTLVLDAGQADFVAAAK